MKKEILTVDGVDYQVYEVKLDQRVLNRLRKELEKYEKKDDAEERSEDFS